MFSTKKLQKSTTLFFNHDFFLTSTVTAWSNWENITEAQKAELIIYSVHFGGEFALYMDEIGEVVEKAGKVC